MNDELKQLEREVEAMLAEVGPALDVTPHEAAVMRAKEASARALNEAWLEGQNQPAPSTLAVERAKAAVAAELAAQDELGRWRGAARYVRGLAAAAVVALVIGGLWALRSDQPADPTPTPGPELAVETHVETFVDAAEDIFAEDTVTASILSEIQAVEASLQGLESDSVDDFQAILSEIDELLASEPEPDQVRSGVNPMPRGALG